MRRHVRDSILNEIAVLTVLRELLTSMLQNREDMIKYLNLYALALQEVQDRYLYLTGPIRSPDIYKCHVCSRFLCSL